jgi:hypothetical protein
MASFFYKAVRMDGEALEGQMEALDEAAVIRHLQQEGLIPLSTRRAGGVRDQIFTRRRRQNLTPKEIGTLTRETVNAARGGANLGPLAANPDRIGRRRACYPRIGGPPGPGPRRRDFFRCSGATGREFSASLYQYGAGGGVEWCTGCGAGALGGVFGDGRPTCGIRSSPRWSIP